MQQERLPIVHEMILATSPEERAEALAQAAAVPARRFPRHPRGDGGAARSRSACSIRRCTSSCRRSKQLLVETTELRLTEGEPIRRSIASKEALLRRVQQLHEQNPMLGLARLPAWASSFPRSTRCRCARSSRPRASCSARGVDARPDVMIPGVGTKEEMQVTRDAAKRVADAVLAEQRHRAALPHRHDDRAAARVRRRRRAGRVRRVLLVRHQRSHADDLRLQPRRRRGLVHSRLPREARFSKTIRSRCSIGAASAS